MQSSHRLLGQNASSVLAQAFLDVTQYVAHGAKVNSRGGYDVLLPGGDDAADDDADAAKGAVEVPKLPTRFSVEEVTSMILTHAKQFSEAVAGAKIKDALLVVPAYTTQNQRLALADALELTGMKVSVTGVWNCVGGTV